MRYFVEVNVDPDDSYWNLRRRIDTMLKNIQSIGFKKRARIKQGRDGKGTSIGEILVFEMPEEGLSILEHFLDQHKINDYSIYEAEPRKMSTGL